jgi:hypothetical protein
MNMPSGIVPQASPNSYQNMHKLEKPLSRRAKFTVVLILGLNLALCITSVLRESLTYDEPTYIGIGRYMAETADVSAIAAATPPLPFFVNSTFWYFLKFDPSFWQNYPQLFKNGYQSLPLIFESGHDPDLLVFLARLPVILTFPVLLLMIFFWARELFGEKAAFYALILASFCPNLMAHARLATTDFLAALTIFGAMFFFRKFLKRPTWSSLFITGMATGIAFLTRFTAVILLPSYIAVIVISLTSSFQEETDREDAPGTSTLPRFCSNRTAIIGGFLLIALISFLVVWMGYGFEFRPLYVPAFAGERSGDYFHGLMNVLFERQVRMPASSYIISFYHQFGHGRAGHPTFLIGSASTGGRWYYFPFAFLIKTPIPALIFICISVFMLGKSQNRKSGEEGFLLIPIIMLLIPALTSNINVGLRHILPVYPFLFVWVSRVANFSIFRWCRWFAGLLILWYIGSNFYIYPHYLEYFNEFIGGPKNGYKYLVDSNLDWGQDLRLLTEYLKEHKIDSIKLIYFGAPGVAEYSGFYNSAGDCEEVTEGYVAISATFLYNLYLAPNCYEWLKKYQPIDRIAYSIFIYKIPSAQSSGHELPTR